MDDFFLLMVLGSAIIPVISVIAWIAFVVSVARRAEQAAQAEMQQVQQMLETYKHLPKTARWQMQPQINQLFASTNTHLRQMDNLHRQQYQAKVESLQGMAAQAGLDWTPPNY